jgi:hypothetical protein
MKRFVFGIFDGFLACAALVACLPKLDVASGEPEASTPSIGSTGGTSGDGLETESQPGRPPDPDAPLGPDSSDVGGPAAGVPGRDETGAEVGTGVATPSLPLTLVEFQPAASAVGVSIEAPLSLTFSAPIDPASVPLLSIEVLRSSSLSITGTLSVKGSRVSFVPAEPLLLTNSYVWRFQGTVRSVDGAEWTGSGEAAFKTREGAWSSPENLASAGDNPRIAFDGEGNALAIWNQVGINPPSAAAGIGVARFTPAGGWRVLPSPASCGPQCTPLLVAADKDGAFEIVWSAQGYIYGQPYHTDAGFGETAQVFSRGARAGADGAVSDGEVWLATNVSQGIIVSRTLDGASWLQDEAYLSDVRQGSAGPVLVADGPGRARVFWVESSQLLASSFSEGSWSTPQFVPNFRGDFTPVGLSGAGVPAGNALLAWEEDRPSPDDPTLISSGLSVVMMAANGAIREESGPRLPDGIVGNAASPAVAMSPRGDALLTWLQSSGDPNDADAPTTLWGAFHAAAATAWSAPSQLSIDEDGVARPPAVGIDPSGNGHVLWVTVRPGGEADILEARFNRESGLFGATGLISATADATPGLTRGPRGGNDSSQLAVDSRGRALGIWADPAGGIWTIRFE